MAGSISKAGSLSGRRSSKVLRYLHTIQFNFLRVLNCQTHCSNVRIDEDLDFQGEFIVVFCFALDKRMVLFAEFFDSKHSSKTTPLVGTA
jgi:hypothetical protein